MENSVIFDLRKKAPGRGAYVHPNPSCFENAMRSGFSKSFRSKVWVNERFINNFIESVRIRLQESIRVAFKSNALRVGGEMVAASMKKNEITLLLIASDAGGSVRKKFVSNAARKSTLLKENIDGKMLGTTLGKDYISVMGVVARKSEPILRDIEILETMGFLDTGLNLVSKNGIGIANGEEVNVKEIVGREND